MVPELVSRYVRSELLPTAFCPGCGNGVLMKCFLEAVYEEGYEDLRRFVFVSGIGCAAWIPSPYLKADTLHVLHGRAIPVATGVKLVRPDLEVVVISGDGDLAGIGLGHLVHAARRNMDLLVIMVNNMVFAMTGGQTSPTTPLGARTSTAPQGCAEPPIDVCSVLSATNANYVARWTTLNYAPLKRSIREALRMEGFRFIEVLSQCPSRSPSRRRLTPAQQMRWLVEECRRRGLKLGVIARRSSPGLLRRLGRL